MRGWGRRKRGKKKVICNLVEVQKKILGKL